MLNNFYWSGIALNAVKHFPAVRPNKLIISWTSRMRTMRI